MGVRPSDRARRVFRSVTALDGDSQEALRSGGQAGEAAFLAESLAFFSGNGVTSFPYGRFVPVARRDSARAGSISHEGRRGWRLHKHKHGVHRSSQRTCPKSALSGEMP